MKTKILALAILALASNSVFASARRQICKSADERTKLVVYTIGDQISANDTRLFVREIAYSGAWQLPETDELPLTLILTQVFADEPLLASVYLNLDNNGTLLEASVRSDFGIEELICNLDAI